MHRHVGTEAGALPYCIRDKMILIPTPASPRLPSEAAFAKWTARIADVHAAAHEQHIPVTLVRLYGVLVTLLVPNSRTATLRVSRRRMHAEMQRACKL